MSTDDKNTFHNIHPVTNADGKRIGRGYNSKIFKHSGGMPVAIISGAEIKDAIDGHTIGTCKHGKIFKQGITEPVAFYKNGIITKPPPDSGEVVGHYAKSDDNEGAKAAAFLLILSEKK